MTMTAQSVLSNPAVALGVNTIESEPTGVKSIEQLVPTEKASPLDEQIKALRKVVGVFPG
jgi:hypothetical protein